MERTTPPPLLVVAVAASAAAGLVHAAAAGSHADLRTLSALFAVVAVLQLGWAALAWTRPRPAVVVAGAAVQAVALATLLASRTVGISFVDGLDAGGSVGFQELFVGGLEVVALVAALASIRVPASSARLASRAAGVFAAAVLLAAVPAMASPHEHDHGADDHDHVDVAAGSDATHVHDEADTSTSPDEHDHTGDAVDTAEHDHATEAAPTDEDLPYPASFAAWLDTADTPEHRAAAEKLLVDTTEAMQAFPDEAAVQAAGFVSIGDGATGWEHYINVDRIMNPAILDPSDIESIVLKVNPDGTKQVASAMYLLPFGTTMDDAPDIAGDLTTWHDHQNLCWEGVRVVGTTGADGSCARGEFRPTQPMIHVWMIDHPCGPFAGIDGSHGEGCAHHH